MDETTWMTEELTAALRLALEEGAGRWEAALRGAQEENEAARGDQGPVGRLSVYPDARIAAFAPELGAAVRLPAGTRVEMADGLDVAWMLAAPAVIAPLRVLAAELGGPPHTLPEEVNGQPVRAGLRLVIERVKGAADWADPRGLDELSLWFGGASPETAHVLFQAVHFHLAGALARTEGRRWSRIEAEAGGFGPEEVLFPAPDEVRFLAEAALFPEKFFFLRLRGLADVFAAAQGPVEVVAALTVLPKAVRLGAADFRLNCVPVVNLSRASLSPVEFSVTARDRVLGEGLDVLAVEGVAELRADSTEYGPPRRPGLGRGFGLPGAGAEYAVTFRPRAPRWGFDAVLSRVDHELEADSPASVLTRVDVLRCDGARAGRVPRGAPLLVRADAAALRGELATGPLGPVAPRSRGEIYSTLEGLSDAERLTLLRRFLRLAAVADGSLPPQASPAARSAAWSRWGEAILDLEVRRKMLFLSLAAGEPEGPVNGRDVIVTVAPQAFPGAAPGLFVAALDRCLGLFTSVCEFTRLTVRTAKEEFPCPPRLGSRADL